MPAPSRGGICQGRRTGLDVARALRERRPALSVIVLTGVSERELEERARELEGFTVLRKPLRLLELEAQVRRLLGGDAGGGEPPSARGQGPVARGQEPAGRSQGSDARS